MINMTEMAKPIFTIQDGGPVDPYKTVWLNESRQYIHVRLNNIVKTYSTSGDETVMTRLDNYYPVVPCTEDFMSNSEFERNYH